MKRITITIDDATYGTLRILQGRMIEIFKDEWSLTGVINFLLLMAMYAPDYMSDSTVAEMLRDVFIAYTKNKDTIEIAASTDKIITRFVELVESTMKKR